MKQHLTVKRIYEPAAPDDGIRVLIDRIWPRGLSKAEASFDYWIKDIAPSTALRKWFGHAPERWPEFRTRYTAELDANPVAVARLRALVAGRRATLLFSAHDSERNNAVALCEYLGAHKQ